MLLERAALLEARGIPNHLDEVAHVGAVPQHLYVLLEDHFADALALLEDEAHPVSNPVYADDLEAASEQLRQESRPGRNRLLNRIAWVCIVILAGGFVLVGFQAWFG